MLPNIAWCRDEQSHQAEATKGLLPLKQEIIAGGTLETRKQRSRARVCCSSSEMLVRSQAFEMVVDGKGVT
jgi:hypothetical protein